MGREREIERDREITNLQFYCVAIENGVDFGHQGELIVNAGYYHEITVTGFYQSL